MFVRHLSAALVGCALLLAPFAAKAERGPSTPAERKQALESIHHFEADPLNANLKSEVRWVVEWAIEIPDVHFNICEIATLPKSDKQGRSTLFSAMILAQIAFVLQNPDRQEDLVAQYQAGVEGVLHSYEILLKANPKDRQTLLDDLIEKRESGTLELWVKERAAATCHQ
jgi:hypothetical protein